MLLNAQSHEAVKLTLSATSIIFTAKVKASTLLSLPKEPAVDVQMPLPAVLPTTLPDLWDIKVVRGPRGPDMRPQSQNLPPCNRRHSCGLRVRSLLQREENLWYLLKTHVYVLEIYIHGCIIYSVYLLISKLKLSHYVWDKKNV